MRFIGAFSPIDARSEATRRSHASARLAPPPAAGPFNAAITGFVEEATCLGRPFGWSAAPGEGR